MTTASALKPTLSIVELPIDGILPSPSNPRKTFKAIDELAENIKVHGIKVPLRVRPIEAREDPISGAKISAYYEVVFGERRLRAARKAGLEHVPAIVEKVSDVEALELMLVELAQTSDVHPVEEAEAYRELHVRHGMSVEEIAAKVGKSKRVVYERMQLCSLVEAVRKAALEGKLPPSHAVLLARVPSQFQEKALEKILQGEYSDGLMTHEDARDFIIGEYTLALSEAPWDLKDEELVLAAGSCSKCPKRTGNQPELFADVKAKDTCTDPACFKQKKQAFVKLEIAGAKERGKPVIETAAAAKKALSSGEYLDVEKYDYQLGGKVKDLLKGKKVELTIAPSPEGLQKLVKKEDLQKVLPKSKDRSASPGIDWKKQEEQRRRERDAREALARAVLAEIYEKATSKSLGKAIWFIVANRLVENEIQQGDGADALIRLFLQREPTDEHSKDEAALLERIAKKNEGELQAIAVATVGVSDIWSFTNNGKGVIAELASCLGVDVKKVRGELAAKQKAEAKAEAKGATAEKIADETKAAKKAAKPKKGGKK